MGFGLGITRAEGESFVLQTSDGHALITIQGFIRGEVRLTIKAPPAIRIFRSELLDGSADHRDNEMSGPVGPTIDVGDTVQVPGGVDTRTGWLPSDKVYRVTGAVFDGTGCQLFNLKSLNTPAAVTGIAADRCVKIDADNRSDK